MAGTTLRTRREGKSISAVVKPELRRAAHYAADQAIQQAKKQSRETIQGVGLGRLANVVDATSSTKKRRTDSDNAWGAIYARGGGPGRQSRGEQALLSYALGATIVPRSGRRWLAFPTKAIPQRGAGGFKMTPELWARSGMEAKVGKLVFLPRTANMALLIVRDVNVSRRTGRAARPGPRKSRGADRKSFIVAFILIRFTRRAKRFDQDAIVAQAAMAIPRFAEEFSRSRTVATP